MLKTFMCFVAVVMMATAAAPVMAQPNPEATQEVRNTVAETQLKASKDTVMVYAEGLCCPSCAIGVRKMVSKLSFVDQTRLTKGVELDAKHQLVTVAVKSGHKFDMGALRQAIADAGYDPIHLYTLKGKKMQTDNLVLVSN